MQINFCPIIFQTKANLQVVSLKSVSIQEQKIIPEDTGDNPKTKQNKTPSLIQEIKTEAQIVYNDLTKGRTQT